jgi:hypothetical protein
VDPVIRLSKSPELPVVLLEDLGALVGLALAFTGITLAVVTGEPRFDGAAACAIGALLVVIAVILLLERKSLLIGESASVEDRRRIEAEIAGAPYVRRLLDMKTLHLGSDELLVAAKVEFDRDLTSPPSRPRSTSAPSARERELAGEDARLSSRPVRARSASPPSQDRRSPGEMSGMSTPAPTSSRSLAGVPTRAGKVPKWPHSTCFAPSRRTACAACRGPMV